MAEVSIGDLVVNDPADKVEGVPVCKSKTLVEGGFFVPSEEFIATVIDEYGLAFKVMTANGLVGWVHRCWIKKA